LYTHTYVQYIYTHSTWHFSSDWLGGAGFQKPSEDIEVPKMSQCSKATSKAEGPQKEMVFWSLVRAEPVWGVGRWAQLCQDMQDQRKI
jgi:hypothetical protein